HTNGVLAGALQRWGSVYDADPLTLPAPPSLEADIPIEIPQTILQSGDHKQRMDLARSRINFHWVGDPESPIDPLESVRVLAERLVTSFSQGGAHLGRLALVLNRLAH